MHDRLTCEHVIPKWARRSFDIKGPVTVDAREEGLDQRRRVGAMQALNITLDDAICEECNSVWLSRLERAVKPLLAPMAVSASPTTLSPARQKLLATWAVKTVLLLELAFRQMYQASLLRPAPPARSLACTLPMCATGGSTWTGAPLCSPHLSAKG